MPQTTKLQALHQVKRLLDILNGMQVRLLSEAEREAWREVRASAYERAAYLLRQWEGEGDESVYTV